MSLLEISRTSSDLDELWLISGALADIRDGFHVFQHHHHTRKVAVFGLARTQPSDPSYQLAEELAAEAVQRGSEVMTVIQTGRTPPMHLVMLAPTGDDFWPSWLGDMQKVVVNRGLISAEDTALLKQARSAAEAMDHVSQFYRVFHTAQFAEDVMELLLHTAISAKTLDSLNHDFDALVEEGAISQGESCDAHGILRPCLRFHLDKRRIGLLYRLIDRLNGLELPTAAAIEQPGQRLCATPPRP